ncbi:alkaline phosphatase family protein [Candidatus Marsarchaeota archaeon]|nr:alkaline phosphatase family protein [Candidatus Marsarchaeota archaeon]
MEKRRRLYIIGIDSAPVWIIKELMRSKKMAGFSRFIKDGTFTDLESTLPPITAAAWPSIYTGLPPGKHGVMNFFSVDKEYAKQLTFYDADRNPPFWDVLGDSGRQSLIITPAMVTEPSSNRNVDMITGFPLGPRFSSKKMEDAAKRFGFSGEPEIEQDIKDKRITLNGATKIYESSIRKRAQLSKHMIRNGNYDLVFVCFTEIDRIQHYCLGMPDWKNYLEPLYAEISDFIEWLIGYDNGEGSSFVIVSDHGAQPIKKKILINSWLINEGYAKLGESTDIGGTRLHVTTARKESTDSEGLKGQKYKEQLQLSSKQPAMRFICASVVENDYEEFVSKKSFDMKNTKAFASLSNNPVSSIWLNDGRFSQPSITSASRVKLLDELNRRLLKLKAGKENAIAKLHSGKSYYNGSNLFIIPDIIIEAEKGYTIDVFNHSEDSIFAEPEAARSGDHTRYGVFGFYSRYASINTAAISVLNVSPTVFDYFRIGSSQLKKGSKIRRP